MANIFDGLDKFFVGSDYIFKSLTEAHNLMAKTIPGYPPYNVAKVGDNKYVIELAVAGFGKNDLEVELNNNVLSIKGNVHAHDEQDNPFTFLYKGIAERAFTRTFALSDGVEIQNAELVNGMLKIWLERWIPEPAPKKIAIKEKSDV